LAGIRQNDHWPLPVGKGFPAHLQDFAERRVGGTAVVSIKAGGACAAPLQLELPERSRSVALAGSTQAKAQREKMNSIT
jgi:hypothetical protein